MQIKIDTSAGELFSNVAEKAKAIAERRNKVRVTESHITDSLQDESIAEFDFNGITCYVSKDTNLTDLHRDYCNSFVMGWKKVGPICEPEYSLTVQAELSQKKAERDKEHRKSQVEHDIKVAAAKAKSDIKMTGIVFELADPEGWEKSRAANKDGYGAAILDFAEDWAKLMQVEIGKGKTIDEVARTTSEEVDKYAGVSGYMYGTARNFLTQVWAHREEFKVWADKDHF